MQGCERRFAEAAFGLVIDALEREIVVGLRNASQIGQRVADFGPLVESRTAYDFVREPQCDESLFEFAHLKRGAHQDGDLVEGNPFVLGGLDLIADSPSLLLTVPNPRDRRPLPKRFVGEQRLSQAPAVMRDQSRRDGEDVAARSIISLEPDHFCAGKIPFEPQDVFNIRAAPRVDRLIVVADAAQIAVRLGKEAEPKVLNDVRVLVLVDQDIAEAPPETRENFVMLAEQPQGFEQQIAEIDGVERLETRLVALIESRAAAGCKSGGFGLPACVLDRCLDFSIRRSGSPALAPASVCRPGFPPAAIA